MAQPSHWLEYWSRDYKSGGKLRTRTMYKLEEGYIISPTSDATDDNLVQYLKTGRPKHYDQFSTENWTKHCVWDDEKEAYDTFIWNDKTRKWVQVPLST